ncbi:MAG: GNAT family N-acetyltransferase [Gammaproteobacteria bacterium]|nr:GNAT family N-acetyltransferase [Gammaproteobacteria bacterium]MDH5728981.1 GNAT family N-acetyltransferase [Gammaproteobacteria bacterium]
MNQMTMTQATEADETWLFDLYQRCLKSYIESTWGWDEVVQKQYFLGPLHPSLFKIISVQQQNVAVYLVKQKNDHIWLEMLLVEPAWQRKGIGSFVMEELKQQAKQQQQSIKLSVIKVNPVIGFYKKHGFTIIARDDATFQLCWP